MELRRVHQNRYGTPRMGRCFGNLASLSGNVRIDIRVACGDNCSIFVMFRRLPRTCTTAVGCKCF